MAISLVQDQETLIVVNSTGSSLEAATSEVDLVVIGESKQPVVIEVLGGLQGEPGLQNVVVSATPPANPFEGMVWIDIS